MEHDEPRPAADRADEALTKLIDAPATLLSILVLRPAGLLDNGPVRELLARLPSGVGEAHPLAPVRRALEGGIAALDRMALAPLVERYPAIGGAPERFRRQRNEIEQLWIDLARLADRARDALQRARMEGWDPETVHAMGANWDVDWGVVGNLTFALERVSDEGRSARNLIRQAMEAHSNAISAPPAAPATAEAPPPPLVPLPSPPIAEAPATPVRGGKPAARGLDFNPDERGGLTLDGKPLKYSDGSFSKAMTLQSAVGRLIVGLALGEKPSGVGRSEALTRARNALRRTGYAIKGSGDKVQLDPRPTVSPRLSDDYRA